MGMAFMSSGSGMEMENFIPKFREQKGNKKSQMGMAFMSWGSRMEMENSIPKFREQKGNKENHIRE